MIGDFLIPSGCLKYLLNSSRGRSRARESRVFTAVALEFRFRTFRSANILQCRAGQTLFSTLASDGREKCRARRKNGNPSPANSSRWEQIGGIANRTEPWFQFLLEIYGTPPAVRLAIIVDS